MHWLLKTPPKKILFAVKRRVLPNLRHLDKTTVRRCRCCERISLFMQFSETEEFRFCAFCRANLRYEMLGEYLRSAYPNLAALDVLELDPDSSIRPILARARTHQRTYFDPATVPGAVRTDGARMEDITGLTFPEQSFDIIVSSEVLEHVPNLNAAFQEMYRVLRPGGVHIFTVPPEAATKQLAKIENGEVMYLVLPPEYHGDPLSTGGILAFWHLGPDLSQRFAGSGLKFSVVKGPEGVARRIVWEARRPIVPDAIAHQA